LVLNDRPFQTLPKKFNKSRQEPSKSENDVVTVGEDLNGFRGVYVVPVWVEDRRIYFI